jgi:5-methylcytosine-specific restriction enzyme A
VPIRLCLNPRCPRPATHRGWCAAHRREKDRERARVRREDAADRNRLYASRRWWLLRRAVLFEQPLCACGCGGLAEEVDHIRPLAAGGDRWARENLQGLARQCHAAKTRRELAARGWPRLNH